ncbi:class I SAM-dependent methyltransferase [Acidimangrovimonas pyrenivorans]|uniref:Class I SAM-dependent methyltransferase n=1 Tax=Acidimangrovimonas pyrenivorans TaxID=2030798 RepID=A0ABV7AIZ3_9RHOB
MTDAFFTLHDGLEREGPGDRESLDWALALAAPPPDAFMLDAGCGPGADIARLLAHAPRGRVLAMDRHAPFVARVLERFSGDGRVWAMRGDMAAPPGRYDLIWCAGALYFLGIENGLRGWRRHLAPGGRVAFSQLAWQVADPSAEARAFWAKAYPEMTDAAGVLAAVAAAGYRVLGQCWLPDAAWEAYLGPLDARCDALAPGAAEDLRAVIAEQRAEAALWRAHRDEFGYLQLVVEAA